MGTLKEGTWHAYGGPDRRRHRVYVTKNSEYHCRDGVCVAVRDRRTQAFDAHHHALGQKISSSIRFSEYGGIASIASPDEAVVGEQLCFSPRRRGSATDDEDYDEQEIITSIVNAIERPAKEVVSSYPAGRPSWA